MLITRISLLEKVKLTNTHQAEYSAQGRDDLLSDVVFSIQSQRATKHKR